MLQLRGGSALSPFRQHKLITELRECIPALVNAAAQYIHFVDVESSLTPGQQQLLEKLLSYGPDTQGFNPDGQLILVTPRRGTISPWSSKATEIAHGCGLQPIQRIERGTAFYLSKSDGETVTEEEYGRVVPMLHDRMTESVFFAMEEADGLFLQEEPAAMTIIDVIGGGKDTLQLADRELGLALSADEFDYVVESFSTLGRNPTDVELMMFAQVNSEHCRHKIFNANWVVDGVPQDKSLFDMIRHTFACSPRGILSAYHDNAAVLQGYEAARFFPDPVSREYIHVSEQAHINIKVETHNHPTAIAPFPGAATGAGGEIRDEAATGRGAKPKAGLAGFSVSNLRLPDAVQPWETDHGKPGRIASALDIMLQGPIGAAAFNNEYGRPNVCGYFRTYEELLPGAGGHQLRGYHKPIMIAGGLGTIRAAHIEKGSIPALAQLVVLGGPAMLIGLGGGAASSMASGTSTEILDFASVQRGNPEIQRRCQEVIDRCWQLGDSNPIIAIHDVGAGGLSNALPELVHDSERGAKIELRTIPNDDPGMSPMQIWCNEAQERFVLAIALDQLSLFKAICERERCPYAVVGEAIEDEQLVVGDGYFDNAPIDLPIPLLFGKAPKMLRNITHHPYHKHELDTRAMDLREAAMRILHLPAVADKTFLITIGDRSVGGLVARDQMVGPWQAPVADVAVTVGDYTGITGEAMAMGERTPIAIIHPAASGRMAIGEALTNIAASRIGALSDVKFSANWMAAAGHDGEDAALFTTVKAVAEELCPALGIAIPVGKDSLSMKTVWEQDGEQRELAAPLSLIISAFAPVIDVCKTLTPQLRTDQGDTDLILIDLGKGHQRLGGSALAQVYKQIGHHPPDLDDPQNFKAFFKAIQDLNEEGLILAYHDRSDGGLFVTVCEMAFAGHSGVNVMLDDLGSDLHAILFSEELGAVIQVRHSDTDSVLEWLRNAGLGHYSHVIGELNDEGRIAFMYGHQEVLADSRINFQRAWSETTWRMQALRDNSECAWQEYDRITDNDDPGLNVNLSYDPDEDITAPFINSGVRPRIAILREQGVNGHVEMAAAFARAGFASIDVHMSDLIGGGASLADFQGIAACGGFSYGDVLGAGEGWAKSILYNSRARDEFAAFFERRDSFGLGVCNGCQMMSNLQEMIPGADLWPHFVRNTSEQFEARFSLVEILPSPSLFLEGMAGSGIAIVVAHGEGRAEFRNGHILEELEEAGVVTMRYIDNYGRPAENYPANPNGSKQGVTGFTSRDGRFTIMMPHPERVFRTLQNSWHPADWNEDGPWLRLFRNARKWLG